MTCLANYVVYSCLYSTQAIGETAWQLPWVVCREDWRGSTPALLSMTEDYIP